MSLKVNYVQLCLFWAYFIYYCEDGHWPPPFKIKIHQGGGPSRPRTSHERTRQIDETFKYFINLAWHRKYKDSMHLAGSRESWRLSPRVNHSQWTTRESASGISSASANETNDDERVNESGERGQFVHFKESFVRTDSFANEPTLGSCNANICSIFMM